MERKTRIKAEDGRHDLLITREFDLPVELVFRAHAEAGIIEQWMGTRVLQLEAKKHGSWHYQTQDDKGNVVFEAHGVFHAFEPDKKITRTFEMLNAPFETQLEFLEFEPLTDETSRLSMQIVYRTSALRDQMLKLPFEYGLNMAHNRLQQIFSTIKK